MLNKQARQVPRVTFTLTSNLTAVRLAALLRPAGNITVVQELYLAAHDPAPVIDRHSSDTTDEGVTASILCSCRGEQIDIALFPAASNIIYSTSISALAKAGLGYCHRSSTWLAS